MNHDPQQIMRFLGNYYPAISQLYDYAKAQNYKIEALQLENMRKVHGINKQLEEYNIIKWASDTGGYYMEEAYFRFLSFLKKDFSLDLPEQLDKYRVSFKALLGRLCQTSVEEVTRVAEISDRIVDELIRFRGHLNENTNSLEKAVDALRAGQDENEDYAKKIAQATYLIDTFLQPMNQILKSNSDSIISYLNELRDYTYQQAQLLPDPYRGAAFRKIHTHLMIADGELERHLNRLIRNLLPLLEQMRMRNRILAGFKKLRDAHIRRDYDFYLEALPRLVKKKYHYPYNFYREADADGMLSEMGKQRLVLATPVKSSPDYWVVHVHEYRAALLKALPVTDFFVWCYDALAQHNPGKSIYMTQFFQVANLLFDHEFTAAIEKGRSGVTLEDAQLGVPRIKLTFKK
ncbi:MAG: hypothetical protein AAF900_01835 [Bacteroidota bacterium]